jgi:hypothetical protein
LQAAVDDAALQVGAPPPGGGGVLGCELASFESLRALIDERAGDLGFAVEL